MRKIKKINGYLVVKFNDRELREWADTALGNYGVIDAELYTGCLDVDRSVMEYDGAETLEEAIEQARGLESELEVDEPSATYTVIKETDDATEEDTVEPQLMIAGWKLQLETQVKSRHYSDIDPRTAAHELYGFMVALERLGLIEEEDCFVKPDAFKPQPGADFVHSPDGAPTRKTFELGLELMAECPSNDCMLYRNIFEMCLDLDEQIDRVTGLARRTLEAELYKHQHELFKMWMKNYAVEEYRRKRRAGQIITPHKPGDGGILTMPLRSNVPNPKSEDWKLTSCPVCGAECWESPIAREAMAAEPNLRAACTACALKAGAQKKTEPPVEEATPKLVTVFREASHSANVSEVELEIAKRIARDSREMLNHLASPV